MRVRVSFVVDVDVEAWMSEYGVAREDVRDDVRTYIENGALDQLRDFGLLVKSSD